VTAQKGKTKEGLVVKQRCNGTWDVPHYNVRTFICVKQFKNLWPSEQQRPIFNWGKFL